MDAKGMRRREGRRIKQKLNVRRQRCVEQTHDMVENIMVDPN